VGDLAQTRGDVPRKVRGAAVLDLRRVDVLEPVIVDLEAVALLVGQLDGREQTVIVANTLDEADGDVDSFDVLLDEHAVRVRAQDRLERALQLARLLDHGPRRGDRAVQIRAVVDALARALVIGLDDEREREPGAALEYLLVVAHGDEHATRRVDAGALHHELGEVLVERDRVGVRVRARERDAELLEQRRVERFAHTAAIALGGVEDDIRIDHDTGNTGKKTDQQTRDHQKDRIGDTQLVTQHGQHGDSE